MLTTSHPIHLNQSFSARVEKRGPWMTTTTPLRCQRSVSEDAAWAASPRSCGQ